jgi:hypothetical protein
MEEVNEIRIPEKCQNPIDHRTYQYTAHALSTSTPAASPHYTSFLLVPVKND